MSALHSACRAVAIRCIALLGVAVKLLRSFISEAFPGVPGREIARHWNGAGSEPDKLWMVVQVIPRPLVNVVGKVDAVPCVSGRLVDDAHLREAGHNAAVNTEEQGLSIAFQVSAEDVLFFGGEMVQARSGELERRVLSILLPCPCAAMNDAPRSEDAGGKDECGTEIRLVLLPKVGKTDVANEDIRGKQENTER